jgi:acetoacetate decarboxylase
MKEEKHPFDLPVVQANLGYIEAPNRFINREYFIVTYATDMDAIVNSLPQGLSAPEPLVKYEFMNMPDATGFGSFHILLRI